MIARLDGSKPWQHTSSREINTALVIKDTGMYDRLFNASPQGVRDVCANRISVGHAVKDSP